MQNFLFPGNWGNSSLKKEEGKKNIYILDKKNIYIAKKLLEKAKTYLAQKFDIFSWDFATFIAIKNGVFDLQADLQPLWFTFHITKRGKKKYFYDIVSQLSEIQSS